MTGLLRSLIVLALAVAMLPSAEAATITVDTLVDADDSDGDCSLREALFNASNNSSGGIDCAAGTGADTIAFDAALFTGTPPTATITLDPAEDQLEVTGDSLLIAPPSGSRLVLAGTGAHRIVYASQLVGASFELRDTDIRQGSSASGGGAAVHSQFATLDGVRFIDNVSSGSTPAAGLYRSIGHDSGSLVLRNCEFHGNVSVGQGSGLYFVIDADDDITVEGCRFAANASDSGGTATFVVNAIGVPGTPEISIHSTHFDENNSDGYAGGAWLRANDASARVRMTIQDSSFTGNRAALDGAGVYAEASPQATGVALEVLRTAFVDNVAATAGPAVRYGGAIHANAVALRVENSLFARNSTYAAGAAIHADYDSNAVPVPVSLVGNSFFENWIPSEIGPRTLSLEYPPDSSGWTLVLRGNVWSSHADAVPTNGECHVWSPGNGLLLDAAWNVADEASCTFGAQDLLAQPLLVLAGNGSLDVPWSLYPQPGSPVVDAWPVVDCVDAEDSALAVDHAGDPRPRDGDGNGTATCDAGAFELPDAGVLGVLHTGDGSGRVLSQPAGIDCGAQCSAPFAGGTEVRLTASASAGSVFTGWSGDCTGTGECIVEVAGDRNVEADFALQASHQLAIELAGDGHGQVASDPSGIACEPLCDASFASGANVALAATPDFDSAFTGWSGGGCSGTGGCLVALGADTDVVAEFTATAFVLDVARVGSGSGLVTSDPAGIACPDDCSVLFDRDETVTLAADAAPGSVFTGWEGDCSGDGTCVLDMDAGPYAVDARFELLRTLDVSLAGNGTGSVTSAPAGIDCPGDCSEAYANGASVTLTASAAPGSVFTGWSGIATCSGTGPCTVSMTAARALTAAFQTASYALTVTVEGGGQVASNPAGILCPADCSETFTAQTQVTLTATPETGFDFAGWTGACSGTGSCQVTVDAAKSVGASFAPNTIEVFANGFE